MREKIAQQRLLLPALSQHKRALHLAEIGQVLDAKPAILGLVLADLTAGVRADDGRRGLTAEQVLRILVLQRVAGLTFDELEFALEDSQTYRTFCRIGFHEKRITRSRIHANVHKVRAETIEAINLLVVQGAIAEKIEDLERTRTDATVTETNIHHPTDSHLLWDAVRMIGTVTDKAVALFGVTFTDRRREAKLAYVRASTSANEEERMPYYHELVEIADAVMIDAQRVAAEIGLSRKQAKKAAKLTKKLESLVGLGQRVVYQTKHRVFEGKKVPAAKKVLSVSEPHTDLIVKDRRDCFYGHKITLTTGTSGLFLDCVVEKGNPADATLAVRSVQRLKTAYGRVPPQVAFDGSYASAANLAAIKAEGVKDVAFSKGGGLKVADMVRALEDYQKLRNFRAGIEGGISVLKRAVGLGRCVWKGLPSFRAYVWGGVFVANLLTLARYHIG